MHRFEPKSGRQNAVAAQRREGRASLANFQTHQLAAMEDRANQRPQVRETAQLQEKLNAPNTTGMSDELKTGLESLSGMDLSGVQVHYNSPEPAQLQAHAFTQGQDIHVAPGQERHVAHEGWHVVQQMQGRVRPDSELGGQALNTDVSLEQEADLMGARAQQSQGAAVQRKSTGRARNSQVAQRVMTFADYEQAAQAIIRSPSRAYAEFEAFLKGEISLDEYQEKLLSILADIVAHEVAASGDETFSRALSGLAGNAFNEVVEYLEADDLEDIAGRIKESRELDTMVERVKGYKNLPSNTREVLSIESPGAALKEMGATLPELEEWALLNEDIGGERFQIMDELAKVLRPFREMIKEIIPGARLKYRGSLVRGLKGYPKEGVAVNTGAYDCDAFIEVPSEFWLNMRKAGAQGVERDPISGEETGKVEIRGYEPLDQITFKKEAPEFAPRLEALKQVQAEAQAAIEKAQKSGALPGYKYEEGKIDFEFFIRPVYNTASTYAEGNPYLIGQVASRGYPALEKSLGLVEVKEFEKKKDRPESSAMLGPYVAKYGPHGVVMPEYQAVIGKHGWYLETEELNEWRMMKRKLDQDLGKIRYSRRALPEYQKPLPGFQHAYGEEESENPLVTEPHNPMYDIITQRDVVRFGADLQNLNNVMSGIKLFDRETNILSLKDPHLIPVIADRLDDLIGRLESLLPQYPVLEDSTLLDGWMALIDRILKKIGEAIELRDVYGGSKKIVRDHSLERKKTGKEEKSQLA